MNAGDWKVEDGESSDESAAGRFRAAVDDLVRIDTGDAIADECEARASTRQPARHAWWRSSPQEWRRGGGGLGSGMVALAGVPTPPVARSGFLGEHRRQRNVADDVVQVADPIKERRKLVLGAASSPWLAQTRHMGPRCVVSPIPASPWPD